MLHTAIRSPLILLLPLVAGCGQPQRADQTSEVARLLTPMQFDSGDPYRHFGYAPLMFTGFGLSGPVPRQFRSCHKALVDTLVFQPLTFELRGNSMRGYFQDFIEGNPEPPVAMMSLAYDTIARILTFDVPTAPRTLLSFELSPSCDALVGVELIKTAYHPQDGISGVAAVHDTLRRGPHPGSRPR